jgi:hypothetical protein
MAGLLKNKAYDIIRSFITDDNVNTGIGIMSAYGPPLNVNIEFERVTEFYSSALALTDESLTNYFQSNYDISHGLPFAETIMDRVPVMVDLFFEFNNANSKRFYDMGFIGFVTKTIQRIIKDCIKLGPEKQELVCFVLESNIWSRGGKEYQKLRFHFPYTGVSKKILQGWFHKELAIDLADSAVFSQMYAVPNVADWEKIIVPIGKAVPLYGSRESEDVHPLRLKCVLDSVLDYDFDGKRIENYEDEEYIMTYTSTDELDPLKSSLFSQNLLNVEEFFEYCSQDDKMYLLPLLLSIHFYGKNSEIIPQSIDLSEAKKPVRVSRETGFVNRTENTAEVFDGLMNMINPERCTIAKRYYWMDIGKIAHNVFGGNRMGLERFIHYSHEELKAECEVVWENFSIEYLDLRTLMQYAHEDSPDAYANWIEEYSAPYIEPAIKGKNMTCAELYAHRCPYKFVYDRAGNNVYHMKRTHCVKDIQCCELRKSIRSELKAVMERVRIERERYRDEAQSSAVRKERNRAIDEVVKVMDSLDDVNFLDNVIKALKCLIFDDNFSRLYDENVNTIACTNVVIECYDNTICHRPGKLQDYITLSTDIPFPIHYTKTTKQVQAVLKFYGQLYCEPELYYDDHDHDKYCHSIFCRDGIHHGDLCHFILKDDAAILLGGNDNKRFRCLEGESHGGKSQKKLFYEAALGRYCRDFPHEEITATKFKNGGGPNPAVNRAKGARMCIVSETGKDEPVCPAKVKGWTGGDRHYTRSHHEEGSERKITWKLYLMTNIKPVPNDPDEAYEEREVLYPHLSKFVLNAPDDENEQYRQRRFKRDPGFHKRIPNLGPAMLWLMFHYYPYYVREGVNDFPRIIKERTEAHQKENNPYHNFIKQKVVVNFVDEERKVRDDSKSITVFQAFQQYRRWYSTFSPDTFLNINQTGFKNEMVRGDRLGPLNAMNEWTSLSFRGAENRDRD